MNNKITVKLNGSIEKRVKKNGNMLKVDKKRNKVAKKLNVIYHGVLEYITPFSKKQKPALQRKVIVQTVNGFLFAMTAKAFYGKKQVKEGERKTNSYAESLITEYLISKDVNFLREICIVGYKLSDNYKKVESSLSSKEIYLLERLERALVDFAIVYDDKTTILLSIEGKMHHKQYDKLWKEFSDSGLASKLGYIYMTIDTTLNDNLKNNFKEQKKLFDNLSKKLCLPNVLNDDELRHYEDEILVKKACAIIEGRPDLRCKVIERTKVNKIWPY